MDKIKNIPNIKYIISESLSLIFGILTFAFLFIPAVFEDGKPDMSIFDLTIGSERLASSPLLFVGFIAIILGFVATIGLLVLLLLKKSNDKLMTIISIASIVLTITGIAISSCAIFISGFDKLNSALGFTQGQWGIKAGNILVPVFGLLSICASYPCALVILHKQDLKDKNKEILPAE